MNYLHQPFGQANKGDRVRVTLSRQANVHLLDSTNYHRYRHGKRYPHLAAARSSHRTLPVPHAGHWHVAIDLGAGGGQVRGGVQLVRA